SVTQKSTQCKKLSGRYAVYLLVGNSPPVNIRITGDPLPTSKLGNQRRLQPLLVNGFIINQQALNSITNFRRSLHRKMGFEASPF
ncbi:hypothetical protein, partial [Okeania sp. SIO2C9]|uniref:hypothetical protein n=1 Tax=Okeania sp. SIO2C9 TaxID=2607791 RepID=UPI0025D0DB63